ncbi:hypothetical protein INS49_007262 [Diaporthe citri]|uniref:uncharacterized protein n=1 Tax=Diaporthe citri TaxID=83186 RepID=UPI001C809166|nr:uncharacterized protein INS49_007262 [Diaporthe citri]KAG6365651.1 hypothetical protein INS49_007262 [Diaporthe citri]
MPAESRSWVEAVDVDRLRDEPEKLRRVVEDLKRELLQSYNELDAVRKAQRVAKSTDPPPTSDSASRWPGRSWVPAETSYPSDDVGRMSCLHETHVEVLVYDCKAKRVEVLTGLRELYSKKALFAKLPSRLAGELRVCIEQIPPTAARSTPRYRITEKQVPKDMAIRHSVSLSDVSSLTRCKILLGRIKWIFILNAGALSDSTDESWGKGKTMV